jgi:hypothetical protein
VRLKKASMIESAHVQAAPERPTMKMTEPKSHFPVRPAPKRKRKRKRHQPAPVKSPAPLPEKKETSNG